VAKHILRLEKPCTACRLQPGVQLAWNGQFAHGAFGPCGVEVETPELPPLKKSKDSCLSRCSEFKKDAFAKSLFFTAEAAEVAEKNHMN